MVNQNSELRSLNWGESQFDNMSREELIRHCQRLYSAVESLKSSSAMFRVADPTSLYWTEGTGGRALLKGEQAITEANKGIDEGSIYHAFYRYAVDLLFTPSETMSAGFGWSVCPACLTMLGRPASGAYQPKDQDCCKCNGTMRPLQWEDLKPNLSVST